MGINRAVQNAYFKNYMIDEGKAMSSEDFKRWLMRFDMNKDGKLSVGELERAIRTTGRWFSKQKAKNAIMTAGKMENGFIHEGEIKNLEGFARKHLGLHITSDSDRRDEARD